MSKEQELNLQKNRKKFDIREEYYVRDRVLALQTWTHSSFQRLSQEADEHWEQKRVPRPTGLPEWGVAPPQTTAVPDGPIDLPKKSK